MPIPDFTFDEVELWKKVLVAAVPRLMMFAAIAEADAAIDAYRERFGKKPGDAPVEP